MESILTTCSSYLCVCDRMNASHPEHIYNCHEVYDYYIFSESSTDKEMNAGVLNTSTGPLSKMV